MSDPDQQATSDPSPVERLRPLLQRSAPLIGLIGIVITALLAGAGRLLALDRFPGGLADIEATYGSLARQAQEASLRWVFDNAGEHSIPFITAISVVGQMLGFDAVTPRIAAAVFGAASILCTGLWLRREAGPFWAIAGAVVLAGSFWHILFSRLAIEPIAGAFALAATLWFLAEASARRGRRAIPWYLLTGLAVGLSFLAMPALRLLPLLLPIALGVALYRSRQDTEQAEVRNWLLATLAAALAISPFLVANRTDPLLWTPWAETPGLPGTDRTSLPTLPGALIETATAFVLPADAAHGLNLPADPWFSLLMLPWAMIGALGLIVASNKPDLRDRFLIGLGGVVALWIGVSAVDAGHPGQLVVVSPLLAGLVVCGFRTAIDWARMPTVRVALALLVVFGLGAEAFASVEKYRDEWSNDPETRRAVNAGLVNALIAIEALETDEPVFVNMQGNVKLLDYFVTASRRHVFDGALAFPFPVEGNGYSALPEGEPLNPAIDEMLGQNSSITLSRDTTDYRIIRLDDRIREQLPFSVPTYPYRGSDLHFLGSRLILNAGDAATLLLAWNTAAESSPFLVDVRAEDADSDAVLVEETRTLPENPLDNRLYQVLAVDLNLSENGSTLDFALRVRDDDRRVLTTDGVTVDGFLHLDRYVIQE